MLSLLLVFVNASDEGFIRPISPIPWADSFGGSEASPLILLPPLGASPVDPEVIRRHEAISNFLLAGVLPPRDEAVGDSAEVDSGS